VLGRGEVIGPGVDVSVVGDDDVGFMVGDAVRVFTGRVGQEVIAE